MTLKKGNLFFSQEDGWVICTGYGDRIKVNKDNVIEFGLKKNNHYYRSFYHFNSYGDLCIWFKEHSFSLDKSTDYIVKFEPTEY